MKNILKLMKIFNCTSDELLGVAVPGQAQGAPHRQPNSNTFGG
jgi:hypothetical protein